MNRCKGELDNFFYACAPRHLTYDEPQGVETQVLGARWSIYYPNCGMKAGRERQLEFVLRTNNRFILLNTIRLDLQIRCVHSDGTIATEDVPAVPAVGDTTVEGGDNIPGHDGIPATKRPSKIILINNIAHTLWSDVDMKLQGELVSDTDAAYGIFLYFFLHTFSLDNHKVLFRL